MIGSFICSSLEAKHPQTSTYAQSVALLAPHFRLVSIPMIREIPILYRRPHPKEQSPRFGIPKPGNELKTVNGTSLKEQPWSETFPVC